MRETPLLHEIRAALAETGRVMIWRNNTGTDLARGVRYGIGKGGADLVGILRPNGRFIGLEVKTSKGRVRPEQELWMRAVRSAGGFACVVRSVADALAALTRAEYGDDS